ncbi:MAG: stage V sporulation protein AC [Defluviitaleaceae bacterium]|nr:stage V sporulation protein AC [Defluviitaleaceae bacterium]
MNNTQQDKARFQHMVKEASPNSHLAANCAKAFVVGGAICVVGQFITSGLMSYGFAKTDASMYTSVILIFIAVLLTGIGVYDNIGKFAGAGSAVPITGFANAVAAPAIEFKREGYILGVGAKMFVVAGPVLVYGIATSIVCGAIYYVILR